jgi:hypothetical protein
MKTTSPMPFRLFFLTRPQWEPSIRHALRAESLAAKRHALRGQSDEAIHHAARGEFTPACNPRCVHGYEDLFKVEGDNPTIGLILCSQKNETIARYSVLKESRQLFAKKYRLHLPSEEELAEELKREVQAIRETTIETGVNK